MTKPVIVHALRRRRRMRPPTVVTQPNTRNPHSSYRTLLLIDYSILMIYITEVVMYFVFVHIAYNEVGLWKSLLFGALLSPPLIGMLFATYAMREILTEGFSVDPSP